MLFRLARFLLGLVLLALIAQAARIQLLFILDYVLAGVLVFAFLWTQASLYWVRVERQLSSERSQVGQYFEEVLVLRNLSLLPKLWLEVTDNSDLPGHKLTCVQSLNPLGSARWRARTYCGMRGRYRLGPIKITAGDPFGLFRFQRQLPAYRYLTVYPSAFDLNNFEGLSGALPGGNNISRPTYNLTPNINGLREYRPGDSFNRIHWPSSARQSRLIVKEFEFDPAVDVQIFLDMQASSHWVLDPSRRTSSHPATPASQTTVRTLDSTEEYAVAVTATLAKHFLHNNRSVGLVAEGQSYERVAADRGERQLTKLLETLAVLRAQGPTDFGALIGAELPRLKSSDTLVLVTASLDESWAGVLPLLVRKNIKMAVALIEPSTFGAKSSSLLTVGTLASANIPTYLIKRGDDIGQALDSELARLTALLR